MILTLHANAAEYFCWCPFLLCLLPDSPSDMVICLSSLRFMSLTAHCFLLPVFLRPRTVSYILYPVGPSFNGPHFLTSLSLDSFYLTFHSYHPLSLCFKLNLPEHSACFVYSSSCTTELISNLIFTNRQLILVLVSPEYLSGSFPNTFVFK